MKTPKQNIFITTFALVVMTSSLLILPSQAIFEQETVVIRNDIPGESITIDCYSKDDNLGLHTLSYGADFPFGFRTSFTTRFYCDFKTSHGSGNYGVFTDRIQAMCNEKCIWLVKANGPCLVQSDKNLYCQAWKMPPKK